MNRTLLRVIACITVFAAGCADPAVTSPDISVRTGKTVSSGPTVKTVTPSSAPQNVTLDVSVSGSGFEPGSNAKWLLNGVEDPRVKTNSTTVISSTSLTANITITPDAVPSLYDVAVITPLGKKGIGTEKFTVLAMEQLNAGDGTSMARDVNASGQIVGTIPGGCDGYSLPAVWINNVAQVLPMPRDLCLGRASKINDAGMILGYLNVSGATSHTTDIVVVWKPVAGGYSVQELGVAPDGISPWDVEGFSETGHAVVNFGLAAPKAYWWSEQTGYLRLQDVPGTYGCAAYDVNELDEIIGMCRTTPNTSSELNQTAAFWSSPDAVPQLLPRLSTFNYVQPGKTLNNNGIAIGEASNTLAGGRQKTVPVQWTRSGSTWTIQQLPAIGDDTSPAEINDDGWVTGRTKVTNGQYHAYLWRAGQAMRDLGAIGPESGAFGMTPANAVKMLVVGYSISGGVYRAVVWRPFS